MKRFLDYFVNEDKIEDIPDFDDYDEDSPKLVKVEDDKNEDYDGIKLSKKLENRLKELKINEGNPKINVGDNIFTINDNQGKLGDDIYKFLKSKDIHRVLRINDKGKLDLGCYTRYIREGDGKKIKKVFYFSTRRFQKVDVLDPVAAFLLSLKHIKKENLSRSPVDYIDVTDKGVLTGMSRRFIEDGDPYKSDKRQELKFNKLLMRIVTKEFYDAHLKQKDVEVFLNKWRMLFDDTYTCVVLEGDDILQAYCHETISNGWKHSSCANFATIKGVNKDRYKVYTENTENIKCLAVYHKGKIHARRMMFVGIQTETHGKFKAGQTYTMLNGMFGEGGRGAKADQAMRRWAKDNGAFIIEDNRGGGDIFKIRIQNTCYGQYPPWDYMSVNFKTNEIASNVPRDAKRGEWVGCYGARCPGAKK